MPLDSHRDPIHTAERAAHIRAALAAEYPGADCELNFSNALELLIATVLSAQCTDERVNQVTPHLFATYPTAPDYAAADRAELESILRPLGFQRAKAGHLIGIGEKLVGEFNGQVPRGIDELTSLPGVGRKTALVVRGNAFGLPGITVDTHVTRLSQRLGLTAAKTPRAIERDVAKLVPEAEQTVFSHRVILHGRRVCTARSPRCGACVLAPWCPSRS
ncbi:endonuclease III [Corynebacterium minutissimum]|uniref:Endonuclease III n=1 Tax=Corynebacterium minutissimum TaxID=38301 RepID=A0A2X4UF09_9CORY|nr:endonuclease III [Corynebacterium minutissimum]QPS60158.1 endonuclease III [Corynebacterium minutissimum]QQA79052.1 endonuclease III [Corynebacterium minutissimum]SQI01015.1 endonuclease III [Corynebacterium minutissimum]VEG04917.1 endonuclease III [Corynebacterium minutissimum]